MGQLSTKSQQNLICHEIRYRLGNIFVSQSDESITISNVNSKQPFLHHVYALCSEYPGGQEQSLQMTPESHLPFAQLIQLPGN